MTEESAGKQNEAGLTRFQKIDIAMKIAGVVLALGTLIVFYCQFHGLGKQTKAIWHSNRPALTILPINPAQDIRPLFGVVKTHEGTSPGVTHFSEVVIKIKNVGNSPALVDTIWYEFASKDTIAAGTVSPGVFTLSPKDVIALTMRLPLGKDVQNIFRIEGAYNWEKAVDISEKFPLEKRFAVHYETGSWHVKILSSEQYSLGRDRFFQTHGD